MHSQASFSGNLIPRPPLVPTSFPGLLWLLLFSCLHRIERWEVLETIHRSTLTFALGVSPLITARRFFLRTPDSAAHAAAVRLVGMFVQSPIPNMLPEEHHSINTTDCKLLLQDQMQNVVGVSLSLHEKHGIGWEQEHIEHHDHHIACKILPSFFFQSYETKSRTESLCLSIGDTVQTSVLYHLRFEVTVITWLWTSNDKISSRFRNEWRDKTSLPTILLMLECVLVHINPASCICYRLTLHEVQWTHWGCGMQEVVLGEEM